MRAGGKMKRVFFTIGAACRERDFANIGSLIQNFGPGANNPLHANLQVLQRAFTATGIDLELEPGSGAPCSFYKDAVVGLAQMAGSLGREVTFCPYEERAFWLGCLATIHQAAGRRIVTGLDLQNNGVGETQQSWVRSILGCPRQQPGIADPSAFVNVGLEASRSSPTDVQAYFSDTGNFAAGAQGGWIYDSGGIAAGTCSFAAYAQAIIVGLGELKRGTAPR